MFRGKFAPIAVLLLSAPALMAHTIVDSIGAPMKAVDVWQVTCFDDSSGEPTKLVTQIKSATAGAPGLLSVMTFKGTAAISVTDPINGDAKFSRLAANTGGDAGASGIYRLFVTKTGPGIENYQVETHCMSDQGNGTAIHTGTDFSHSQNR